MSVTLAFALSLVATTGLNIGNALQKAGARRLPAVTLRLDRHVLRAFFTCRIWLLGTFVMIAGWGLMLVAIANAPISIIQPALGFGLIVMAFLSTRYLGEHLHPEEWLGVGTMVIGIVLLGLSATGDDSHAPMRPELLAVFTAMAALLPIMVAAKRRFGLPAVSVELLFGAGTGFLVGLAALYTKAMFVALEGGNTLLALGVFLPVMMAANLTVLAAIQAGFQRGRAMIIVSVNAITNKAVAIVGGMWLLGEYLPPDRMLAAARLGGFALVLMATVLLARRSAAAEEPAPAGFAD
jgi:drug/metabolite transporter (DMT)-like permease